MSVISYTDWTVTCNGLDDRPYSERCPAQGSTAEIDRADVKTAADVRRYLKKRGWAVNVRVSGENNRGRRLDFCPAHKPGPGG